MTKPHPMREDRMLIIATAVAFIFLWAMVGGLAGKITGLPHMATAFVGGMIATILVCIAVIQEHRRTSPM